MSLIVEPQNISNEAVIGGKAKGLLWLYKNGYNCPEWSVLPSSTVDTILGESKKNILKILKKVNKDNVNSSVEEIEQECSNLKIMNRLAEEIQNWIKKEGLEKETFAVRSSFLGEDSKEYSFAGQLESYLNVTPKEIGFKVIECIKSSFSKNIIHYKLQNNLDLQDHSMSVIIQKMIFAEKSGVCFSLNPNTFNNDEIYISASFGDCEGLVAGTSDCDTYVVDKTTGEIHKNVIKKEFFSNLYEGKKIDRLPEELSEMPVLDLKDLNELSHNAKSIEEKKSAPQDVEWAITDKLYFLQVRPVTTKMKSKVSDENLVFDNSNIQESYCGITLPLTFSFASECYRLAYNQLMTFMGFSKKEVDANNFRHSNMLAYVDGRVYYNIHSWYEGLKFMPSFGRSKEDMEAMMGVEEPVDFVEDVTYSLKEKILQVPKIMRIIFKLVTRFAQIDRIAKKFDKEFWREYRFFQKKLESNDLSSLKLIKLHDEITRSFLKNWASPLVNDFFVMVYNGKVRKRLESINELESLSYLTMGEDLESLAPTAKIQELAKLIEAENASFLLKEINKKNISQILLNKKIKEALVNYIDLYGDRCIGELKLETKTYRQDLEKLLKLIKNFIDSKSFKSTHNKDEADIVFMRVKEKMLVYKGKLSWMLFKNDLKKLKKGIKYRESMRLHRTRVVGLFRVLYLKLSEKFCELGVIDKSDDVFFLTHNEIKEFVCGRSVNKNLKILVNLRKKEFEGYFDKEPKHHFKASFPFQDNYIYFKEEVSESVGDMQGVGCYPGVVEAPIELMLEPDETRPLSGKILCTVRTDPGWAPLFPQVKGLLVERGSSLSHSAVVAREMGIPTVVGVPGVTKKIRNHDRVKLDGKSGTVSLVKNREFDDAHS